LEQTNFLLKLNESGEVLLVHEDGRILLGAKDAVCEELSRFLFEVDFGEGG
jgi:hypothetical protein